MHPRLSECWAISETLLEGIVANPEQRTGELPVT